MIGLLLHTNPTLLLYTSNYIKTRRYIMHEYGNFMGFGWIVPLLIITAIFLWLKRFKKTPLDILNERYAKGEINETEYLQKRKLL